MKTVMMLCSFLLLNVLAAADLAEKAQALLNNAQADSITVRAENGILYSINELKHLAKGELVNGRVVQTVLLNFGPVTEEQIPYLKAAYAKKKPRLVYEE